MCVTRVLPPCAAPCGAFLYLARAVRCYPRPLYAGGEFDALVWMRFETVGAVVPPCRGISLVLLCFFCHSTLVTRLVLDVHLLVL